MRDERRNEKRIQQDKCEKISHATRSLAPDYSHAAIISKGGEKFHPPERGSVTGQKPLVSQA